MTSLMRETPKKSKIKEIICSREIDVSQKGRGPREGGRGAEEDG